MKPDIKETILDKLSSNFILISKADNGAFIIYDLKSISPNIEVYEFEQQSTLDKLVDLHYLIDDILDAPFSKHKKLNIEHKIVHGSNYICKDENCIRCGEMRDKNE